MISIVPKLPMADDESSPAQRRTIDARLVAARKGRYYGPFGSVDELLASMKAKKRKAAAKRRA